MRWCSNDACLARAADEHLASLTERLQKLTDWMDDQVAASRLKDVPILASGHQAAFCTRLGMHVVAKFTGVDSAQPSQIDQAIKAGEAAQVRLVIANRPEGRQLADALAERLGARVVVFGNFPGSNRAGAFEEMVRSNLGVLIEGSQP